MNKTEKTVFIIDDDEHVRHSLEWLLSSVNLKVLSFKNAIDFLAIYKNNHNGCLITDVRMPIMSGLDLLEKLKSLQSTLPVIVITGHGDIPMAVRAMKAGAVDFFTKPFSNHQLITLVQKLINTP